MITLYRTQRTLADTLPVYWDAQSRPFIKCFLQEKYSLKQTLRFALIEISCVDCSFKVLNETYSADEVRIIDSEIPEAE